MEQRRGLSGSFFVLSALIGAGLAVASAAVASDGVIEINQAKVIKAGGFPYVISKAGSYRLTSNLDVTVAADPKNTDAIDVNADNVTIDLNGFSILGPAVCTGAPVTSCTNAGNGRGVVANAARTGVKVRNGTIRGMGNAGVVFAGSGSAERVWAESNGSEGIEVQTGSVVNCEAASNGGDGISLDGGLLTGCVATDNKENGIIAAFATISGNTASGNGSDGIFLDIMGVAVNNTLTSNKSFGLACNGGGYTGNALESNNGNGAQEDSCVSLGPNLCALALCP